MEVREMSDGRKDIMPLVWTAWDTRDEWSRTFAALYGWMLPRVMDVEIEWDLWSGENWITLTQGGQVVGYLGVNLPLLVCVEPLASVEWPYPLQVIRLKSLDEEEIKCDIDIFNQCFGTYLVADPSLTPEPFNADSFSAKDLWFHTI
ncbi:MAG: hypothetical protein CSA82_01530 [Actinobacteria bacterium]|nr:MAG: hypothetical protein CSA82_01530 [Actinomycetota bacterium]